MAAILACLLFVLLLSGLAKHDGVAAWIHRWTGHWLTTLTWIFAPYSAVVLLISKLRHHPFVAVAQSLLFLLGVLLSLFAGFTGYLGPLQNPDITDESRNRFFVLHIIVLPSLLTVFLAVWFTIFRPVPPGPN